MAVTHATYIEKAERKGMIYSLAMHIFLLLLIIVGLPNMYSPDDIEEATAITVDILPIGEITNVKPSNSKPVKKDKPKPAAPKKEITSKPLEALKEVKEKPSPAVKTKDSTPAPPKTEEVKDAPPEEKPKDEPEKVEPKEEEDPLDAILKGVKDTAAQDKETATAEELAEEASESGGNRSNNFDPNSPEAVTIRDAIQSQIYRCWSVPAGAKNAENLIIPLEIDYDKDGNPLKVELAKGAQSKYRSDSFFRAAADSAKRAVRRCAPLQDMPPDTFKIWQYVDMNFNPKDMLM